MRKSTKSTGEEKTVKAKVVGERKVGARGYKELENRKIKHDKGADHSEEIQCQWEKIVSSTQCYSNNKLFFYHI